MRRVFAEPAPRTTLVLVGMVAAGVVGMVLSWRGVAATLDVWLQVPFVLSGAFVSVGLIGAGVGLLSIQFDRQDSADERADLDDVIRAVEHLPS
jgi:hypothetical protein